MVLSRKYSCAAGSDRTSRCRDPVRDSAQGDGEDGAPVLEVVAADGEGTKGRRRRPDRLRRSGGGEEEEREEKVGRAIWRAESLKH